MERGGLTGLARRRPSPPPAKPRGLTHNSAVSSAVPVYLEVGTKRVFAAALDWPGWCRSGPDEDQALRTLLDYAPRYAKAVSKAARSFAAPADPKGFRVVERLPGDATTDFGAPGAVPEADGKALSEAGLDRLLPVLTACWDAFDAAARDAASKTLRPGPRGGGRDVKRMKAHVLDADSAYVGQLGGKFGSAGEEVEAELRRVHEVFVETLRRRIRGELPGVGPRGGARWSPRYAVRRSSWHALDHAWEIEDRSG